MTFPFAQRTQPFLAPARLARLLEQYPVRYDLTAANPNRVGLEWDQPLEACFPKHGHRRYTPSPAGLEASRQAIGRDIGCPANRLVLTSSTSEAFSHLFRLLCEPGDKIACPRPGYPLLEQLAALADLTVVHYDMLYDGSWFIDMSSLEQAAASASVLVATSPNNPTGSYLTTDELARLGSFGKPIIVDEVFFRYPLDGSPGPRGRDSGAPLTFSLGGISKDLGLPQYKIGWIEISGEQALAEQAAHRLAFIADAFLSVNQPAAEALPELLRLGHRRRTQLHDRARDNLTQLKRQLHNSPCTLRRVEGGWYAVVQLPNLHCDETWCEHLLKDAAVRVHPGYLFDATQRTLGGAEVLVIVSLITEPTTLHTGIDLLLSTVEAQSSTPLSRSNGNVRI